MARKLDARRKKLKSEFTKAPLTSNFFNSSLRVSSRNEL